MNRGIFKQGLKAKFLMIFLVIVVVATTLTSVIILCYELPNYRAALANKGVSFACYVADLGKEHVLDRDILALDRIVKSITRDTEVAYTFIYDNKGNLLTDLFASINLKNDAIHQILAGAPADAPLTDSVALIRQGRDIREVIQPITLETDTIGTVVVGLSQARINAMIRQSLVYLLCGNFVFGLIIFLLLSLLQKIFVKPILQLAGLMQRISTDKDYAVRAPELGHDELGELAAGLNHMLEQIELREIGLDLHRRGLENLVAQRTAELAQLSERQNIILETAAEGIIGLDENGHHIFVNNAACWSLGWPREALIGRSFDATWRHPPEAGKACRILGALREGSGAFVDDEVFWRADNSSFFVEYAVSPIRDKGKRTGAVVIFKDITARKEAEEAMNKLKAKVIQSDKLATLGEMATGIAHEINQPLNAIVLVMTMFRKAMQKKILSEERLAAGLDDIDSMVERMTRTINHIRAYARQETQTFTEIDVPATMATALAMLDEQMHVHAIGIIKDMAPALPLVMGEAHQLEQVWINLVSNARDAMDDKQRQIAEGKLDLPGYQKTLRISAALDPETGMILVAFVDNGVGANETQIRKAFEPFFTTKDVGQGTGLGLSISHAIIKAHKGRIEMEGKPGEGVTVKVYLPPLAINS